MSKGMKQKIGLIVAFMQNTPILILDEATTSLDHLYKNKFIELIKKEKDKGKTILMSSHILKWPMPWCDDKKKDGYLADENINMIKGNMKQALRNLFLKYRRCSSFSKVIRGQ